MLKKCKTYHYTNPVKCNVSTDLCVFCWVSWWQSGL